MTAYDDLINSLSPVFYLPLTDTSGTTATATSGPSGTYANGPTLGANGPHRYGAKAVTFDGVNQNARLDGAGAAVFPIGGAAYTVSAWIRPNATSGAIFAYGSGFNSGEHRVFSNSSIGFTDGVNPGNNISWSQAPPTGQWNHVAITYSSGSMCLYLNGALNTIASPSLNTTAMGAGGRWAVAVRSDDGRATDYFNGSVAGVAVFDSALTAAQIREQYLVGLGSYDQIILRDSPVLYLPLSDQAGTVTEALRGSNGTYNGSPTLNQTGPSVGGLDKAVVFDGTDDDASVPYTAAHDFGTGPFTFEWWMKSNYGDGSYQNLMHRDAAADGDLIFYSNISDGVLRTWVGGTALNGTQTLTDNAWHHVVVLRNGTTVEQWIDGVLNASTTAAGNCNSGTDGLVIGYNGAGGTVRYTGSMSGIAVYNYALSSDQVRQHYAASPPAFRNVIEARASELGAVLHLPLDDRGGSTAHATVGGDGTYVNGPILRVAGPTTFLPHGVDFDGTNEQVTATAAITTSDGASLEVWANITTPGKGAFIKVGGSTNGIAFGIGTGAEFKNSGSTLTALYEANRWINTGVTLTNGWHHIVMVVEANGTTSTYYVDGAQVATNSGSGPIAPASTVQVGGYSESGNNRFYDGPLAAASVYDRPLTAAEVYDNYRLGLNPRDAGAVGPIRY